MSHVSDFTQPSNKIVLDLINDDNNTSLTVGTVTLEVKPEVIPEFRNTTVEISAIPGSGYTGSMTLEYNRLDIQDFVDLYEPAGFEIVQGEAVTVADLMPEINQAMAINLVEDIDFFDQLFAEWVGEPNETQLVNVPMIADSLVYIGTLSFTLKANIIPLANVITVTILDGLNLPLPEDVSGFTRFSLSGEELKFTDYNTGGRPYVLPSTIHWRVDRGEWVTGGTILYPAGSQLLDVRNDLTTPFFFISGGRKSGTLFNGKGIVGVLSFQEDGHPFINFSKQKSAFSFVPETLPSNVTCLDYMFSFRPQEIGTEVFNQDISDWDISNVTSMEGTFSEAGNTPDISSWNVANVTNFQYCFKDNTTFNQDISGWNVSSAIDMMSMFNNAASFNQDLSGWDVDQVTSYDGFADGATAWVLPQPNFGV